MAPVSNPVPHHATPDKMAALVDITFSKSQLKLLDLPKNMNGVRTTHTCELCGFEPKTKNKYREKQDHLVMKHFKEKIDKIFPHCRPYACPHLECAFTGKDKQALLRHYTGKHGILGRYLQEALAEKGINYHPLESGKRKHSTSSNSSNSSNGSNGHTNGGVKQQSNGTTQACKVPRLSLSPAPVQTLFEEASVVISSPQQQPKKVALPQRPNNEELRKEVEAMMASFQPVEQTMVLQMPVTTANGTIMQQQQVPVVSTPQQQVILSQAPNQSLLMQTNGHVSNGQVNGHGMTTNGNGMTTNGIVKHEQQQQQQQQLNGNVSQLPTIVLSAVANATAASAVARAQQQQQQQAAVAAAAAKNIILNGTAQPVATMATTILPGGMVTAPGQKQSCHVPTITVNSNGQQMHNGQLLCSNANSLPFPIEVITVQAPNNVDRLQTVAVVENEDVMWSAACGGVGGQNPAVVVEAANSVPVTYIDAGELANININEQGDYDFLLTGGGVQTLHESQAREKTLDFNML